MPHVLDDVADRRLPGLEPVVGVNLAQLGERDIGDRKQVANRTSRATIQPSPHSL
ncbi:MAG TPA: hypothetical protein VGN48_01380 [Pedococcus sp.]|nr:hypothetical protein [Pedococcus sp.]